MKGAAFTILVLVLLLGSGCLMAPVEEKKTLNVVLSNWPLSYNLYTAQQKGYFEQQGVGVKLIRYNDYTNALTAFQNNKSMDCLHIVATDLFTLREQGVKVKMILPMDTSVGGDVLVARQGISSIADLRGKIIGVEGFNSFSHLFAIKMLEKYNLSESDVYFEIVSSVDVPGDIASGKLDAGHVYASSLADAMGRGQNRLGDSSETPDLILDGIVCRESAIARAPGDIQKMTNAWYRALALQKENRTQALQAMSMGTGVPINELDEGMMGLHIFDLESSRAAFSIDGGEGTLLSTLQTTDDFLLARGQSSGNVKPQELIEGRFVRDVASDTRGERP